MNRHCTQCGTDLVEAWSFCPSCGTRLEEKRVSSKPHWHEFAPSKGAYGGLVYGVVTAPILILAGVMICLTGWGIFLGIPIVLIGIMAPLAGTLFGIGEHQGKCPKCGVRVISNSDHLAHACPHCGEPFSVDAKPAAAH